MDYRSEYPSGVVMKYLWFIKRKLSNAGKRLHLFVHNNSNDIVLGMLVVLIVISVMGFHQQFQEFKDQNENIERQLTILKNLEENIEKDNKRVHKRQTKLLKCLITAEGVADREEYIAECDRQFGFNQNTMQSSGANSATSQNSDSTQSSSQSNQSSQNGSQTQNKESENSQQEKNQNRNNEQNNGNNQDDLFPPFFIFRNIFRN